MMLYELLAIALYFLVVLCVGVLSYRKHLSAADFIIGGRSLNYWVTALAAHASDMSSWLFMAYPAFIFTRGPFQAWIAVGLIVCMFLNWQFIAPKIRIATENYNSLTFSSFFESRFADSSGMIRIFTALMSLIFYTIYISSGLVGLGILAETLFPINYHTGVLLGTLIVIPYIFVGGYLTLAWIDLFQGMFLLVVAVFVPLYLLPKVGGVEAIEKAIYYKQLSSSLFPDFSFKTIWNILSIMLGWGLGYFGQPHIVTKFMGIKNAREIPKSKWIGVSWQTCSLAAATLIGLIAVPYFPKEIADSEHIFLLLVKNFFSPFLVGLILCAVLAATINALSSQILVVSSSIAEDFYKKLLRKNASSRELLLISRGGILLIALLAFFISYGKVSSIYSLVLYAWSGLGAAFGPLLFAALYTKKTNKYGAWAGILSGGICAGVWPYIDKVLPFHTPAIIPSFFLSAFAIFLFSYWTKDKILAQKTNNGESFS